jgi:hypothetical protein
MSGKKENREGAHGSPQPVSIPGWAHDVLPMSEAENRLRKQAPLATIIISRPFI